MNTITERTVRRLKGQTRGLSLYVVEAREPAPTFEKGDGYDSGRNLLSAVLIGPNTVTLGYVLGSRGSWHAYTARDWREQTRRRSAPVSQWSPQPSVQDAADAVVVMAEQQRSARVAA